MTNHKLMKTADEKLRYFIMVGLDCQDLYPLISLSITKDGTSSHCGPEM